MKNVKNKFERKTCLSQIEELCLIDWQLINFMQIRFDKLFKDDKLVED